MKFKQYLLLVTILAIVLLIGARLLDGLYPHRVLWRPVSVGIALGYLNTLVGYAFLAWGYSRSQNAFMGAVFGGMIFRFLLLFSLLFILITAVQIEMIPLIISLLLTYFVYLAIEIWFVNKNTVSGDVNE
ncbi:MAG: hypothetical protein GXO78_01400 [Calditrichaeota bacterium]|nr:hypothetical protein [Calditrichota bacterium]